MHPKLNSAKNDYDDIIQALRRTRGADAEKCLEKMTDDLSQAILDGSAQFQEIPAYAGLAFRKKFQFTNRKAVLAHKSKEPATAMAQIQGKGVVKIHPSVTAAWKTLVGYDPESAWMAVCLAALGDPKWQDFIDPDAAETNFDTTDYDDIDTDQHS